MKHFPRCALSLSTCAAGASVFLTLVVATGCHDEEESFECDTILNLS